CNRAVAAIGEGVRGRSPGGSVGEGAVRAHPCVREPLDRSRASYRAAGLISPEWNAVNVNVVGEYALRGIRHGEHLAWGQRVVSIIVGSRGCELTRSRRNREPSPADPAGR